MDIQDLSIEEQQYESASQRLTGSASTALPISPSPHLPVTSSPRHRITHPVFTWLTRISRFFLAALFLFTAGAKLAIIPAFVDNVGQLLTASGLNYELWSWPVTVVVIALEIVTAILLLLSRTVRLGAISAGLLLLSFAAFALYYVYVLHGEPLECGCFGGIIGSQLGVKTALRNLALLIPVLLVWFGYRKQIPIPTRRDSSRLVGIGN